VATLDLVSYPQVKTRSIVAASVLIVNPGKAVVSSFIQRWSFNRDEQDGQDAV
jgi:hypothetical protein